jgi:hypothetical protein
MEAHLGDTAAKPDQALGFILLQHQPLLGGKGDAAMLFEKPGTLWIPEAGEKGNPAQTRRNRRGKANHPDPLIGA